MNFAWVNKTALLLFLSLQLFYSNAFAKNVCLGKQIKIVEIGDSLTQGGGHPGEYSYRLPLSILLKNAGYDVDFVGTQHSGLNKSFKWPDGFDNDHEGFYGATTAELARHLKTDLAKIPPSDVALIHLGTSDFGSYNVFKSVVMPMRSIIKHLRKQNPNIRILISQIHLNGFKVKYFRLHLNLLAKYESTVESPVDTVPDYVGFTAKDTIDGMHPSLTGQKKMANAWFKSINLICNKE